MPEIIAYELHNVKADKSKHIEMTEPVEVAGDEAELREFEQQKANEAGEAYQCYCVVRKKK